MLPANVDELVKGLKEASRVVKAEGKALDLFRIAYHAVTSLKSYCVDFSEKGGDDPSYSAGAKLFSSDGGEKTVKQIRVGIDIRGIELKLWSSSKEKSESKLEETSKKIQQVLSSVGKLSGESLQNFYNAVVIERKLDVSLNRLLTGATSQQVYFDVADARERIILLMGRFDPSIIQMENALEELKKLGKDEPVKKEISEKIALSILKWKRGIDEYISQLK
nr:hypothetical protein [Candidatus Freyarchaeota archaeon]